MIYYFHSERMPLYLLTVFAKNVRDDLTQSERNDLAKLVRVLVKTATGEPKNRSWPRKHTERHGKII